MSEDYEKAEIAGFDVLVDGDGRPVLTRMGKWIGAIEYRYEHLKDTYDPNRPGPGAARMLKDMKALKVALIAMNYHRLEIEGTNSVVGALEGLVKSARERWEGSAPPDVENALTHAESVLGELMS